MAKNKRKKYLINRAFQFRFVGTMVLTVILSLLVFSALSAVYYWTRTMTGDNVFKEYITLHKQVTETREVERDGKIYVEEYTISKEIPGLKRWEIVIPAILINNLIIIIIIFIIGIFYSHRIAGPEYRIRRDIDRALAGEENVRIELRRRDSLVELAESVNKCIHRIDVQRGEKDTMPGSMV